MSESFLVFLDVSRQSSRVMAHVLEPPGLGIRFETRSAFEEEFSTALADHLAWLARHGHAGASPPPDPVWQVVEEHPIEGNFESGDDVGFYGPDLKPLSAAEVERYLAIARSAREELVALVRDLPPEALSWRFNQQSRPIGLILKHVARAELWYITRILDDPDRVGMPPELVELDRRMDATADPVELLLMVREGFEAFFRSLQPECLNRVVIPTWFCDISTERWTARKALRRAIEHEREHTRSILRTVEARLRPSSPGSLG